MKTILIFPPQWTPINPHLAVASLVAQLRYNGHEVIIRDLNIEFFDTILKKNHLKNTLNKAFSLKDDLIKKIQAEYDESKQEHEYSNEFKKNVFKLNRIKAFQENEDGRLQKAEAIIENINKTVSIMKSKEDFYTPQLFVESLNIIDSALEIASLPYYPTLLEFHNYNNPFSQLTLDSIKEQCFDRSSNMFYNYFEKILPSILKESPDMVAISINSSSQIVAGLTIAMLLKKNSNIHVTIGGNYFGRVIETLEKTPEFFELFADTLIYNEGEKPIVELAKYIEGKIPIEQVPNSAYLVNNQVKINETTTPMKLNEMQIPSLEGFPLDLYLAPDIVMPIQASRGCYWKKCSFCDHDFGQNYNLKSIDKLIEEIKYYNEKFNISHFEFIDESISPAYLREMSTKILESGLKINWFNNARLETEFTPELLELAHNAGLRMALWGFESGSDKVMELINKGIDIHKRIDVLKSAKESGIWNFAFIFFGFPTETWEDALKTIETVCQNKDIIHSYGKSVFSLGKHTRLKYDPEKYSITNIFQSKEEFSPSYYFETSVGMDSSTINKAAELCTTECNKAYGNPLWMYLRYREILFLYISKYGAEEVQNCKIE